MLPEAAPDQARRFAERLRKAIADTDIVVRGKNTALRVSISLGVASFPNDATVADDLVHEADLAVYWAKLEGRNRVVCAADVPRAFKLEARTAADRLETRGLSAYVPRPRVAAASASEPRSAGPSGTTAP